MKTSKKLSTISFNSIDFLENKLKELLQRHVIRSFFYISHHAEEDTKKDHIHVLIEPATTIETEQLKDLFNEPVKDRPLEPLGCLPWQTTKDFGDWYLYAIHDIDFLLDKGQYKKYHYKKENVIASDNDYLDYLINDINFTAKNKKSQFKDLVSKGWTWGQILFNTNLVPTQQIKSYHDLYEQCILYYEDIRKQEKENMGEKSEQQF